MRKLAQEDCGFEEPTVAMAFVYFEKLALKGKLNKQNRKLCAGACVLLAAKIGSDLKKHEVKHLIDVSSLPSWWLGDTLSPGVFSEGPWLVTLSNTKPRAMKLLIPQAMSGVFS